MTDHEVRMNQGGVSLECRADGQPEAFVGYAARFYRADEPGTEYQLFDDMAERIMPGAFDDVMGDDVVGLFNHDNNELMARTSSGTMSLAADDRGLRYRIPIDRSHPIHAKIVPMIARGDLRGSSFSFRIPQGGQRFVDQPDGSVVRLIDKVSPLYDVGPVTTPAYQATSADMRASCQHALDALRRWRHRQRQAAARIRLLDFAISTG